MDNSPFSRLPAELRNDIYQYALIEEQSIELITRTEPSLLHACRQLRSEALPIYYSINEFKILLDDNLHTETRPAEEVIEAMDKVTPVIIHKITVLEIHVCVFPYGVSNFLFSLSMGSEYGFEYGPEAVRQVASALLDAGWQQEQVHWRTGDAKGGFYDLPRDVKEQLEVELEEMWESEVAKYACEEV